MGRFSANVYECLEAWRHAPNPLFGNALPPRKAHPQRRDKKKHFRPKKRIGASERAKSVLPE
jgi:hypothetical protein